LGSSKKVILAVKTTFLRCKCNGSHDGHFVLKDVKVEPNMCTLLFLLVH